MLSPLLKDASSKLLATSTNNQLSVSSATSHAHLSPSNSNDVSSASVSKVLLKQDSTVSCSSVQSQADRVLAQTLGGGGSPRLVGGKRGIRQLLHQDSTRSFRSVQSGDPHACPISKDSCSHDSTNTGSHAAQASYSAATERTPIDVIATTSPEQLVSLMSSSLQTFKESERRGVCGPSARSKSCAHHCVSILAARLIAAKCHTTIGQHGIASDVRLLRKIVVALDLNNDAVRHSH